MLNATTLRHSENMSKMVLVMDAEKANGKHVSYKDYVNKTMESEMDEIPTVLEERHFEYVSRDNEHSTIESLNRRFFSQRYRLSKPILNRHQTRICMPRFTDSVSNKEMENEDIIDVYDCEDESFWTSNEKVDIDQPDYLFSLKLHEGDSKSFVKMQFSANDRYISVQCKYNVMIFDTEDANLDDDDETKLLEPAQKYSVKG